MLTLDALKKSRSLDFSSITKALTKSTETGYAKDDAEYFKITKDKAGNGSAVIRFLNTTDGDELPFVQIYNHAFQGPSGRWYIENCLSTLGEDDPVNTANRVLWNGSEADKEIAKKRKRKLSYIANVYVVSDPGNRANEGNILKFKFGKKIFEKITEKVEPTFADDKPINVFDYWEGANFKFRVRQYEGYANYDQSSFADPSALAETDEEILAIAQKQFKLAPLIARDQFKTYDELEKKLQSVLTAGPQQARPTAGLEEAAVAARPVGKTVEAKAAKTKAAAVDTPAGESEEDLEDYFAKLAG